MDGWMGRWVDGDKKGPDRKKAKNGAIIKNQVSNCIKIKF